MEIRFVSNNQEKIKEATNILAKENINLIPYNFKLDELQTDDTEKLLRDKVHKAFKKVGRPLIVEHTGLYIESLNGFPGGLTQIFWDTIQADNFSAIFGTLANTFIEAKTTIGYCDGKKIYFFTASIQGNIAKEPKGNRNFQWDCIFIPQGYSETFAEMGIKKNEISMRKKAFDKFIQHIKEQTI